MTKQEEITRGIEKLVTRWVRRNYPIGLETFSHLSIHILSYLDSKDAVIKVDKPATTMLDSIVICPNCKTELGVTGYTATEPLILEG